MPKAYVNTCWCGCSLRTGVFLIGIFDLIVDILHPVGVVVHYVQLSGDDKPESNWVSAFFVGELIAGMVDFIFAIALLVGLKKNSIPLMMSWWWWTVMQLSVHTAVGFTLLFIKPDITGLHIILFAMLFALFSYVLIVVRSYIIMLKKKKEVANELLLREERQLIEM
ncbi:hypothetical protein SK128_017408 [Halocaridina rubra]|uniref:Transmembrane protein n=1 Tax=Halocaridina rubra TaxID=373956 RepID=A0AAN9AH56_HALRR